MFCVLAVIIFDEVYEITSLLDPLPLHQRPESKPFTPWVSCSAVLFSCQSPATPMLPATPSRRPVPGGRARALQERGSGRVVNR